MTYHSHLWISQQLVNSQHLHLIIVCALLKTVLYEMGHCFKVFVHLNSKAVSYTMSVWLPDICSGQQVHDVLRSATFFLLLSFISLILCYCFLSESDWSWRRLALHLCGRHTYK